MGARRFKHFERSLGIAKNTLTSRLTQLVEGGILERVPASDGSAFDEYVLTKKGRELAPVMIALSQWGDKWVAHEKGPSTEIVDVQTGNKLPQVWPRRDDGERIRLREIRMKRANGAPEKNWIEEEEKSS